MINSILRTQWPFMRWLRLALGAYLLFIGISELDILAGSIGGLLAIMALMNKGCGGGSCALPQK
jgi:hypothetical protein